MMFIRSSDRDTDEQRLYFECRNCQSVVPVTDTCIFENNHSDDQSSLEQFMSKNIRYDVTLPRAHNIPCPKCSSRDDNDGGRASSSVLFIKYDADLKFLYFCEHCDTFWKAGGNLLAPEADTTTTTTTRKEEESSKEEDTTTTRKEEESSKEEDTTTTRKEEESSKEEDVVVAGVDDESSKSVETKTDVVTNFRSASRNRKTLSDGKTELVRTFTSKKS
eukprot:gene17348-biopygen26282